MAGRTRSRGLRSDPAGQRSLASRNRREARVAAAPPRGGGAEVAAHAEIGDAPHPLPRDRRSYACCSPVFTCAIARCRTGHTARNLYSLAPIVPGGNAAEGGNGGTQRIRHVCPGDTRRHSRHLGQSLPLRKWPSERGSLVVSMQQRDGPPSRTRFSWASAMRVAVVNPRNLPCRIRDSGHRGHLGHGKPFSHVSTQLTGNLVTGNQ